MMVNEYMHLLFLDDGNYEDYNFKIDGLYGDVVLCKDKKVKGDGIIWGMKRATVLKAHYTEADKKHHAEMKAMKPIKNGEVVLIADINDPKVSGFYKVEVLGNYSDCCIMHPICNIEGEDF